MKSTKVGKTLSEWVETENGAEVKDTTGSAVLDMYASMGSMRSRMDYELQLKFRHAYMEDPLNAIRCLFYIRDVRCGLGERRAFRVLLGYAANKYPEAIRKNLELIPLYGRFDDLYALMGTPVERDMWRFVGRVLKMDKENMEKGLPCSLLAKWLKKADSSNENTRKLGIYTAKCLGMSVYDYKRLCVKLRRHIGVVEQMMSEGKWSEINYSSVPSRAMMVYRNAFQKHDDKNFSLYLKAVKKGEEVINSSTLYPYDIVEKILFHSEKSPVLEAQWRSLPNYVKEGTNALVLADVSSLMGSSLGGRPLATAVGMGIYFAERNVGVFHNRMMTFSKTPEFVYLEGKSLYGKVKSFCNISQEGSVDLESAFEKILDVAVNTNTPPNEMFKTLIVISNMEVNQCTVDYPEENFYQSMKLQYEKAGYSIPNVIFWNVNSMRDLFLADKDCPGVQFIAGQSTSCFKHLMNSLGRTPMEEMNMKLGSNRYAPITV